MRSRLAHLVALALIAGAIAGCGGRSSSSIGPALPGEPIIRVRVAKAEDTLTFERPEALRLGPAAGDERERFETPLSLTFRNGRWHVDGMVNLQWSGPLSIEDPEGEPLPLRNRMYPERLVLVPRPDLEPHRAGRTRFDVVNHVHIEAYLPGVLDRELYPDWRPTTFYAQAIAARSYAIHNLLHASADRHYDVESTQASQAYGGTTANLRAAQAVLETTGLVLTDGRGVLKAFYSSTCGGAGASPTDAFGIATDQRPLRPVARRAWCRDSKHFTWGPIRRGRADLSVRIAAWGKRRGLEIAKLGTIRSVAIAEFNHVGRPSRFALTDASGRRFELVAESFRQACNHTASGLPARGERLKSAFVEVERRGEQIVFTDGRGFGHGVGLCQFGAEAMANAGRDVVQVLQTYYPGAQIERVY